MIHKKTFVRWYVGDGLGEMYATWRRITRVVPTLFSCGLLLRTLFAPWHRDVSPKTWRGFNPLRSVQRVAWNMFSRVIGAIVRLCVIATGIAATIVVTIGFGVMLGVYVLAPALLIVGVVGLFTSALVPFAAFAIVVTLGTVAYAFFLYNLTAHPPYNTMSVAQLTQYPWFRRVYDRLGIPQSDITATVVYDMAAFERLLRAYHINTQECEFVIAREIDAQNHAEQMRHVFSEKRLAALRPIGLWWHYGYTIHLDRYTDDLTQYDASQYMRTLFRGYAQEMHLMEIILARPNENNVLLTGEVGSGRHMLTHELARRIRVGHYDGTFLQYMRVLVCDLAVIMARSRADGEDPEDVLHTIFYEAAYAGNVILVVDNFEQYMVMDDKHGFSFSALIDEYAALPTFRMIAIASQEAFRENIEADRVLMRHFDVVSVREMSAYDTMHVLFARFCDRENLPFTYQAFRHIIVGSERYANTAPLPTRAIDLAVEVALFWQKNGTTPAITEETVNTFITYKTGIPTGTIQEEEQETLLSLEEKFHRNIIGQDAAVRTVAAAVRRMRSGMARPHKPAGSFLFLGPTGVGKTEMAKTLAAQYYGSADRVVRVDMSEYQGPSALDRLIGSKELGQKGVFVSAVRAQPYTLILLDEIEKANDRVLDVFLQVLDEGFLHDAFGRKVNFENAIIIATSNAGALTIKKMVEMGIDPSEQEKRVIDAVLEERVFRPEFVNRFDNTVIFAPLTIEEAVQITELLLAKFSRRVAKDQDIALTFDDDVATNIVQHGFDPVFGARSLEHYIDDTVADALAKKLIAGNVRRGETVHFGVADMDAVD